MAKCKINGCNNETKINSKTGKPNLLCTKHYKESIKGSSKTKTYKPKTKKEYKPKVETFVLRGNTLTVNLSANVSHIKVDRFTRCMIFNEERQTVSGNYGKYILQIKQGVNILKSIVYFKKHNRDSDFVKLQGLLSKL